MKNICITGANGFIGKSLCEKLSHKNKNLIGITRSKKSFLNLSGVKFISVGNIGLNTNWNKTLENCEYIIHCAGKAHSLNKKKEDLDSHYSVNTLGTKCLAEQASKAGVKRFIFLSSIKVNGESTSLSSNDSMTKKDVFTKDDKPNPENSYAKSKFEAEKELWDISLRTGLEVVVIRLPLVYGYGAKGNLAKLTKLIQLGIPLPFSNIKNQRSMIGIDNLINLLICCIDHPEANGKTFLVSDGQDLTTGELISLIALSIGRKPCLFPLPISLLKFLASIIGKKNEINRLVGSLKIDTNYTQEVLNWKPPVSVAEGIRKMIKGQ